MRNYIDDKCVTVIQRGDKFEFKLKPDMWFDFMMAGKKDFGCTFRLPVKRTKHHRDSNHKSIATFLQTDKIYRINTIETLSGDIGACSGLRDAGVIIFLPSRKQDHTYE